MRKEECAITLNFAPASNRILGKTAVLFAKMSRTSIFANYILRTFKKIALAITIEFTIYGRIMNEFFLSFTSIFISGASLNRENAVSPVGGASIS